VEKRRTEPDDSLLSSLVAAEEEGDRLSSGELVATAALLLVRSYAEQRAITVIDLGLRVLWLRESWLHKA
jgi:cytochrome P450